MLVDPFLDIKLHNTVIAYDVFDPVAVLVSTKLYGQSVHFCHLRHISNRGNVFFTDAVYYGTGAFNRHINRVTSVYHFIHLALICQNIGIDDINLDP